MRKSSSPIRVWLKFVAWLLVLVSALAAGGRLLSDRNAGTATEESEETRLDTSCAQTANRLRRQLGAECQILSRPPFVLAGDLAANDLARWHATTIAPAAAAMRASYFRSPPTRPITVLMFHDHDNYDRYSEHLFAARGISRFGFYKPNERTVMVSLATGEGPLLHELTHALMDFDFPEARAWLNEGLASLHERCELRHEARGPCLAGLTNWRLPGLQTLAQRGPLRPIAELVAAVSFSGPQEGAHYAQARCFCLYLQRQGLLERIVHEMRDHREDDPSGLGTLARVLGENAWARVDEDFRRFALGLDPS